MNKKSRYAIYSFFSFIAILFTPLAQAHVKWFVEYDVSTPPLAISAIISNPIFWGLSIASIIVMLIGFNVDQRISPVPLIEKWENKLSRYAAAVMRWGVALFFIQMEIFFPHMILTPELISDSTNIRYLHLGIAFTALLPSTAILSGLGLIALYLISVKDFGLIHLLDYTMYWGVIIFMFMETIYQGKKRDLALHIMRIFIVFCLLWGGIEKFAHPQLTYNLLAQKPELTFGMNPVFFLQAAAFVEICAAFLIISGRTAAKVGALILLFFFLAAIIPFGLIDAVGHIPFITAIVAVSMLPNKYAWKSKFTIKTVLFVLTFIGMFIIYYGSFNFIVNTTRMLCDRGVHHACRLIETRTPRNEHL